jgi:4-hydroxy-tetrahydrodipicolinate synthase
MEMKGKKEMFHGSMVAIITPFKKGRVDEKAFSQLIEFQINNGTDAIVPCGTTGESATLSHEEHKRVIELCVEIVAKRVPVIAGTGSNSTEEAIMLTRHAQKAGVSAALLISPYYNKPTQEGLYRHFKEIADQVDLPLVLYNIPGRTGVNLLPATLARLCKQKNIVAVKESSGSLQQIAEVAYRCGRDLDILSGDDALTLPIMAIGGKGAISVTANLVPQEVSQMVHAMAKGKLEEARALHQRLFPLTEALFLETNPIPVKTALSLMGRCSPEMRLPLCPLSSENLAMLKKVMKGHGLL